MRAWPLHACFVIILMGSLAVRERTTDVFAESGSLEPAVLRVAHLYGLAFRERTTITDTDVPALVFDAPGCSRPVLVVSLLATFDQEPVVRSAHRQRAVLRYVYIERSWDRPRRLAVLAERMKYAVLAAFGLTRYVPSGYLLLVELPSSCSAATAIDWRDVWDRDYLLKAAGARTEAMK
jgi:hypothetical protein